MFWNGIKLCCIKKGGAEHKMYEGILKEELKGERMLGKDEEKPKCRLNLDDKNSLNLIDLLLILCRVQGLEEELQSLRSKLQDA